MSIKIEPLFFEPLYKNVIWGGNLISRELHRNIEGNNIGESWELSAHPNNVSKLRNENINLIELFNDFETREKIFGKKCINMEKFPILIKFIDAKENLSVQVHPNDEYAKLHENDSGKNEVWYVMDCKEDAKIVYGLNDKAIISNNHNVVNNIMDYLNYQPIKKGDFIYIPAGTIHAILGGTFICEIQQSSDLTYRVYDWDRVGKDGKPRELHKEKAIDVIDKNINKQMVDCNLITGEEKIYKSNNFSINMINISSIKKFVSDPNTFASYVVIDGIGKLNFNNSSYTLEKGTTFLVPASLGEYELKGKMKLLKVYL